MTEEWFASLTHIEWIEVEDPECGLLPEWFSWERFADSRLQQFASAQNPGVDESYDETSAFESDDALIVNA